MTTGAASSPEVYRDAVACFESVSARQPDVASVWSGLAMLHVDEYAAGFGRGGDQALESARAATANALALDRDDFFANMALTRVQFFDGDPAFRDSIERTLELRPNSVQALAQGGFLLAATGDSARGLLLVQKTRELSKAPPGLCYLAYAVTYLREGRFEKPWRLRYRSMRTTGSSRKPSWPRPRHTAVATISQLKAVQRLRELYPQFEADALANFERWHFDPAFYDVLVSGLEEAGLELREGSAHLSGG